MDTDLLDRIKLTNEELAYMVAKNVKPPTPPPQPQLPFTTRLLVKGMRHEYSTMSPIDPKHRGIIIQHPGGANGLHRMTDGGLDQMMPAQINHSSQPRWLRSEPDSLLFLYLNILKKWNAGTGAVTTIREFSGLPNINGMGEADLIAGKSLIALTGGTKIFVYDYVADKIVYDFLPLSSFDNFYLTCDGEVIVGYHKPGHILHRANGSNQLLATGLGHMDTGRDKNGNCVMVWCNSADDSGANRNAKLPNCTNAAVLINVYSGQQKCLTKFDWGLAMHISLPDTGDFAIVSTYNANGSENLLVGFDGSVVSLGKHGPALDYGLQPHASITPDGLQYTYNDGGDTWIGQL